MTYIFLSYAKFDRETAFAIRETLQNDGIVVWMDESENALEDWRWPKVEKIIQESGGFALLVSDAAKQSAWVKRELDYAEKIQKPIFPILIQGEGWERLKMETAKLGLGLKLDLPDDFAAKMEKISKDAYTKILPDQIIKQDTDTKAFSSKINSNIRQTLNPGNLFHLTTAIWVALAIAIVFLLFRISSLIISAEIESREMTAIAATATSVELTEIYRLANIVSQNLPCEAGINFEVVKRNFITLYTYPSSEDPVRINGNPGLDYPDELVSISEHVVNEEGVWYYITVDYASGQYSGYVRADKLVPMPDCFE